MSCAEGTAAGCRFDNPAGVRGLRPEKRKVVVAWCVVEAVRGHCHDPIVDTDRETRRYGSALGSLVLL